MEWIRGEVIGRGSFGTVNLATMTETSTSETSSVVVKSSHISNSSSLRNEKEVLTKLGNEHTNIVKYLGDCVTQGEYNLFLEYASSGNLTDYVKKTGGRLGVSHVRRFTREILKGLCHVHELGFVHCDIKPDNVLVFEDNSVKLADFGMSRRVEEGGLGCTGTPLYMSPEVVVGGSEVTGAVDVWAVGCVVVEMVTGGSVWECEPGCDVAGLFYRIGVRGECPRIPGDLCEEGRDFLRMCFLKDPNLRWSARMLLDHPFVAGFEGGELVEKKGTVSVSPKCPFEFPDWESSECSSVGSGSVESFDLCLSSFEDKSNNVSCRFEEELVSGDQVPDWNVSNGWFFVR
ncbi:hypothetical protein vseg_015669 [Gypsophila vaccaria]